MFLIQPLGPGDEPRGRVRARLVGNRIADNRTGLMIDAGFPARNRRASGCDERTFSGQLGLSLRGNSVTGSLQRPSLVTFTRGQVITNASPLRDWQYLHDATFSIDDPELTLEEGLFDHAFADPFVNDASNGGACPADETAEPLANSLIYNVEAVPPPTAPSR